MAGFDIDKLKGTDRQVAAAGLAVLILSFLPWYGASGGVGNFKVSHSWTAWGVGFWPKLAVLLAFAAAAFVTARAMGFLGNTHLPTGPAVLTLGLCAVATLLIVLRLLTFDTGSLFGAKYGPRFGIYLALLASVAQSTFAFLAFKASGEQLPGSAKDAT